MNATRPAAVLLACLTAIPLLGACARPARAQAPIPGQTAYVLDDREAMVRLLQAAETAIAQNRPGDAADPLLALLLRAEDDVTAVGPELHVGLREQARALMATLPAGVVREARGRRAREADQRLLRARATADEPALWRLAGEFTFTPAAAAALEELADRALERGDDGLAHRILRRYLRYYRPRAAYDDLPWPRVLAKAGAAAAAAGDAAALEQIREAAAPRSAASLRVGGADVPLDRWLAQLAPSARPPQRGGWTTFGGAPSRARRPARPARSYRCRWIAVDLPRDDDDSHDGAADNPGARAYTPIQPVFPATDGTHVYAFNGRHLGVHDLAAGQLLGEHVFRPTNPADRAYMPYRFRHVTLDPRHAFVVTEADPEYTNRPTQRVLHAFGRLPRGAKNLDRRWTRGGEQDPDPVLQAASLTGSPLVAGDTVYMAGVVRDTDHRAYLFAFEAQTGKLRWRRFLCAGAGEAAEPGFQRTVGADPLNDPTAGETMVCAARGVVYVSTNQGVVAAVARGDGELLWLHRYPRRRRPQNPSLWPAVTPLPWQDSPILAAGDRVLVTPRDSDGLHVLAAEPDLARGLVRVATVEKTSPDAELLHLIGATREHAFLAERRWEGDRSVFRVVCLTFEAAPSEEIWSFEIPHVRGVEAAPSEYFTGRGLLTRDFVLVPTNKHLYGLDAGTGRRVFHLSVTERMKDQRLRSFGNVIPAGGGFLCAYPDGLCWWEPGEAPRPRRM